MVLREVAAAEVTPELREIARQESWRYYVPGYEREDLEQEALAAILAATHDPLRGPLRPFARMVARRRIMTLMNVARAAHQAALNESGYTPADSYLDAVAQADATVEARELIRDFRRLQPVEKRVLVLLAAGFSYQEIAARENISRKAVDNHIFDARMTLRRAA